MITSSTADRSPTTEMKAASRHWLRPELRRLNAGAAEQGGTTATDLLANLS
jgi:hypothetical protein